MSEQYPRLTFELDVSLCISFRSDYYTAERITKEINQLVLAYFEVSSTDVVLEDFSESASNPKNLLIEPDDFTGNDF